MTKWEYKPFSCLYAEPSKNGLNRPRGVRGNGYKMVNMGELFTYNRIKGQDMELVPMNEREKEVYNLQEGDLLFARQSLVAEGAGKCSIVAQLPETTTFESHLIRVRLDKKKTNPFFYFYYFVSPQGKANIQSLVMQVAAAGIRGSELMKLNVPYPKIDKQDRIVSILSAYDDLIENNNRRIKILGEMAQTIYNEWFVKFRFPGHSKVKIVDSEMGKIPEGWEVKKVEDVSTIFRGRAYRGKELAENGGMPFLNLKNIERNGGFRRDGLKRYVGQYKDAQTAKPEDIIMAVTDMTQERMIVARAARVPNMGFEQFVYSMDIVKIVAKEKNSSAFLLGMFLYSNFPHEVKQYANGVNVLHLSPKRISEYKFVFPNKDLRDHYSTILQNINFLKDNLEMKNSVLSKTRDLLLPRLISGEIDVGDLDIETKDVK